MDNRAHDIRKCESYYIPSRLPDEERNGSDVEVDEVLGLCRHMVKKRRDQHGSLMFEDIISIDAIGRCMASKCVVPEGLFLN